MPKASRAKADKPEKGTRKKKDPNAPKKVSRKACCPVARSRSPCKTVNLRFCEFSLLVLEFRHFDASVSLL